MYTRRFRPRYLIAPGGGRTREILHSRARGEVGGRAAIPSPDRVKRTTRGRLKSRLVPRGIFEP